jgi:hypothetical protein
VNTETFPIGREKPHPPLRRGPGDGDFMDNDNNGGFSSRSKPATNTRSEEKRKERFRVQFPRKAPPNKQTNNDNVEVSRQAASAGMVLLRTEDLSY